MAHSRVLLTAAFLSALLLLSACIEMPPINLLSVETVVFEDGSGSNTFLLVVPDREECDLVKLRPELESLKDQADTSVYFASYRDAEYKGFQLTYEFRHPEQIPEQIERIKRAVVQAMATTRPTPGPGTPTPAPSPDPDEYGFYNPDQLSMRVNYALETLTGEVWKVTVKINPLLLTVFGPPEEGCSVPYITYALTMPGEITTSETRAHVKLQPLVREKRMGPNSIQWTFENIWSHEEITEEIPDMRDYAFTLTATSESPSALFRTLTRVVAPIVGLAVSTIAAIAGIIKLVQTLRARDKGSPSE